LASHQLQRTVPAGTRRIASPTSLPAREIRRDASADNQTAARRAEQQNGKYASAFTLIVMPLTFVERRGGRSCQEDHDSPGLPAPVHLFRKPRPLEDGSRALS
jgi:hypothetical protein